MSTRRSRLTKVLRDARQSAGLTQVALAKRLGQTQSYVSKYENGEQRLDLIELEAICKAIGMPLPELIDHYLEAKSRL